MVVGDGAPIEYHCRTGSAVGDPVFDNRVSGGVKCGFFRGDDGGFGFIQLLEYQPVAIVLAFTDCNVEVFSGEGDGFGFCAFDQLGIVPGDKTCHQNDAAQQHEDDGCHQGAQEAFVTVVWLYAIDDGHWSGRLLQRFFHVSRAACGQRDFLDSDMRWNDARRRFGLCGLIAVLLLFP